MRSLRFGMMLCVQILLAVSVCAQTVPASNPKSVPVSSLFTPVRDAQAVSVVNQALSAAGGVSAITAITDYTASGTMASSAATQTSPVSVTILGAGLSQFRIDTNGSNGVSSLAMDQGKVKLQTPDGAVTSSPNLPPLSPSTLIFPHLLLARALTSPFLSLLYKGIVQVNGHSAHNIVVETTTPQGVSPNSQASALTAIDIFIDPSTFQVVASQDMIRRITRNQVGYPHVIQYSDYRTTNGISIPYSVTESIGTQPSEMFHLNSVNFNSGLTKSQFQLQQVAH